MYSVVLAMDYVELYTCIELREEIPSVLFPLTHTGTAL